MLVTKRVWGGDGGVCGVDGGGRKEGRKGGKNERINGLERGKIICERKGRIESEGTRDGGGRYIKVGYGVELESIENPGGGPGRLVSAAAASGRCECDTHHPP